MKKSCLLVLLLCSFYHYTFSNTESDYTTSIECEAVFSDQNLIPVEGFIASTHVKTLDGYKPIEELQEGDTIIGFDDIDGLLPQRITNITKTKIEECVKISVNNEVIYAAPHQKFYLPEYNIWVSAQDLMLTDILATHADEHVSIEDIEYIPGSYDIYSITVDGHIFFVTPSNIFVHNSPAFGTVLAGMGKMIEAAPAVVQKTAVYIGRVAVVHPGIAYIGKIISVAGGLALYYTTFPTPGKKVVLPEREYYEKMRFELCQAHAEFLKLKDGLEAVLLANRTLDHSLTNMLLRATRYTVPVAPFQVTVQQEQAYTEAQKANLTILRQADLDNIQAQIVKIQVDLVYHFDALISMRNSVLHMLTGIAKQKNQYTQQWNTATLSSLSESAAMGMYEVVMTQQYLLQCIKSRNQEIRAAIHYYKTAQCAMVLRKTSNLDEVICAEEQTLRRIESAMANNMCHKNLATIEEYFSKRNYNLAQLRNNVFSKVKKKEDPTFSQLLAKSKEMKALAASPQAPKNDDDDKNKKKEEEKLRLNHEGEPLKLDKLEPHEKYKGASYHGTKPNGRKSAGPLDGPEALNTSAFFNERHRIGISRDQIVVLRYSGQGEYHGYVCEWDELTKAMRDALIEARLTTAKGKILI